MVKQPTLFTPQNRSFRYGDGIFETIKIFRGKILLADYHFDRLLTSLSLLKINPSFFLTRDKMQENILELCKLNNCENSARVRLAVYREEDNNAGFVVEANFLEANINSLNEEGWRIDIYPLVRKSCDAFANLKSANYLPYVLCGIYADENKLDECLVLNSNNKLCDASKANIFLILNKEVFTPALHQGCVNGVKRRFIIERLKKSGIVTRQTTIDEAMLLAADEVFLSNAINDIRWVRSFRDKTYTKDFITDFYKKNFSTIYR